MVTVPVLSWFFTSTPDNCEAEAVAMAAMANRVIPSSCLSLICLSPHTVGFRRYVRGIAFVVCACRLRIELFMTAITSLPKNPTALLANHCTCLAGPVLRGRAHLLNYFLRAFTAEGVLYVLAKDD